MLLKNKKILVGVTASIAVYKALELIRLYIKAGAIVKVIMTKEAKKFINSITFEAISQNKVLEEENETWDKNDLYNHINIGKWSDIFVIAPASANTINKLSHGISDNLLTQTALAYTKMKILCPAANTNMLKNPITQNSLKVLKDVGYKILNTQTKELICKDIGDGAMEQVEEIFYLTTRELLKEKYWVNRKVILSGGGTVEKIDDIRYLSNFSSGKMASSLALALYLKGANVCLISSKGHKKLPKAIHIIEVQSSKEMYKHLVNEISIAKNENTIEKLDVKISSKQMNFKRPFLFMVAAVSDYIPISQQQGKLKKEILGKTWELKLKENIDILSSLDKKDLVSIGFKAETDEKVAQKYAKNMLKNKNLDAVCLNVLNEENPFGSNSNKLKLILKDKSYKFCETKLQLSIELLSCLKKEFDEYR